MEASVSSWIYGYTNETILVIGEKLREYVGKRITPQLEFL